SGSRRDVAAALPVEIRVARNTTIGAECVSVAANGVDESRTIENGLDFLAQPRNGVVNRPGEDVFLVAPQLTEQIIAIDDVAGTAGEILENLEFAMRQMQQFAAASGDAGREVDGHVAEMQSVECRTGTAQHGAHTRQELFEFKRLRD